MEQEHAMPCTWLYSANCALIQQVKLQEKKNVFEVGANLMKQRN